MTQANPTPADDADRVKSAIYTMLGVPSEQRPRSVHEIELEIGNRTAVADGLARLHGAGLIH